MHSHISSTIVVVLTSVLFWGAGCTTLSPEDTKSIEKTPVPAPVSAPASNADESAQTDEQNAEAGIPIVMLPVEGYAQRRTLKGFGEYIQDRFTGYHVGDDIEFVDITEEVSVHAIADGRVEYVDSVSGYGGVMVVAHEVKGTTIHALYGHIDLSSVELQVDDEVTIGQVLAVLGDHESEETDGERKHLHFALYTGDVLQLNGYVSSASELGRWLNPQDFFIEQRVGFQTPTRLFDPATDRGGDVFNIEFTIPGDMDVEYVPSLEALNVYSRSGAGSARERSQFFIRYFDASDFLTLSTVTIHTTTDRTVGSDAYTARQYDIEKKSGVADFADQPSWRNDRHVVTDFRSTTGRTRYFVVAANPEIASEVYETFLASMVIR